LMSRVFWRKLSVCPRVIQCTTQVKKKLPKIRSDTYNSWVWNLILSSEIMLTGINIFLIADADCVHLFTADDDGNDSSVMAVMVLWINFRRYNYESFTLNICIKYVYYAFYIVLVVSILSSLKTSSEVHVSQ
jgi:hypothetical protein